MAEHALRKVGGILLIGGLAPAALAAASVPQGPCATSQVRLDTGYDHPNQAVLPLGAIDARWTVVEDPFLGTLEPRPATVIQKHFAWANPEPGTQWISGYPTSAQNLDGAYWFETTFCLRPGAVLSQCTLQIGMRADDECYAYLNGNLFHTGQTFSAQALTFGTYALSTCGGVIGTNSLRIRVQNTGSVAMGLNLKATLFAVPNLTAEKPECCSGFGALQGLKYNDANGNGQRDVGEPALPGWHIRLYSSGVPVATATTDSEGYYNFTYLQPGTYTIAETQQAGWTQTAPLGGVHVVHVSALQGLRGLDFGNRNVEPCFDADFGTLLGAGDDVTLPLTAIGFAFPFAGVTYSDFYVTTNGFLYLRNGPASSLPSSRCCAGTAAGLLANANGPMVCPLWNDLLLVAANGSGVYVKRSTSATIVTWADAIEYGDTQNNRFHVQLKLHQSGQIDFTYTSHLRIRTTGAALVGVSPGGNAADPGFSYLATGPNVGSSTIYQLFDNGSRPFDLNGKKVTLMPTTQGATYGWNVGVTPCAWAATASIVFQGVGCVMHPKLRYEVFDVARAFDLVGSSLSWIRWIDRYLVGPSAGSFVPPSGAATALVMGDDTEVTVGLSAPMPAAGSTTSALTICSNGFVSTAPGNGVGWNATPAALLARSQPMWCSWCDYDPSIPGSGQIKFEEVGGLAIVTWDGVYVHGTTAPDTFQFQFDLATGNVACVWQSCGSPGTPRLVGSTTGGAAQDPGSVDWSATGPWSVEVRDVEVFPLGIAVSGRPVPGSVVALNAVNMPSGTMLGAILLGITRFDPGVPLDALGMPGCYQYNEGAAVHLFLPPATGSVLQLPLGTAFLGFQLQAQAAVLAPGSTPLGVLTSGGVQLQIGY